LWRALGHSAHFLLFKELPENFKLLQDSISSFFCIVCDSNVCAVHGLFNVESFVDIPKTSCSTPSRLGTQSSPTEERDNSRNAHKVMTQGTKMSS
jgi:hypothetical protein